MAIRIETLGGLRAYDGATELEWLHAQRLRAALVTYLAVERSASRAAVAAVFWPESDEDNARHALRQNLYQVKQVLGDTWLDARTHDLRVSDDVTTDIAELEQALENGDPERAARLYRGPFLDGVHVADLKPWETWLDARRAHCTREFRRACREWVAACRERGDAVAAIVAAQHWIGPDPLDDEGQHALIEALADSGRRTDALRQYGMYAKLLEADGLEPLDETKALAERLEADRPSGVREYAPAGEPPPRPRAFDPASSAATTALLEPAVQTRRTASAQAMRAPAPRARSLRLRAGIFALVALAGATLIAALTTDRPIDADVYLVAPAFAVPAETGSTSQLFVQGVEAAMRRVPGATHADPTRIADERARDGADPEGVAEWVRRARRVGAGRVVLLRSGGERSPLAIGGSLVDAADGRILRNHEVYAASLSAPDIETAAATLVELLQGLTPGVIAHSGTSDEAAARAFVAGVEAGKTWDLHASVDHFRTAVAHDETFARAHFRLAQALAWLDEPRERWDLHTRRANASLDALADDEALLAPALLAMADARYADACRLYETLLSADPFSFAGQYGLFRCQRDDDVVVADAASPSGWSFRSSENAAVQALVAALLLEPAFALTFGRDVAACLERLLYARPDHYNSGTSEDGNWYGALASLEADTLAFVPYPMEDVFSARAPLPSGTLPAARRGQQFMLDIVTRLARERPRDTAALIARAEALESMQALENVRDDLSALAWARRAGAVAQTDEHRVYATLVEVRLLVKLRRFAEAADLANALLDDLSEHRSVAPVDVAALAALTGRTSTVADLMEFAVAEELDERNNIDIPLLVLQARERAHAHALMGSPRDTLAWHVAHLEKVVGGYMPADVAESKHCFATAPVLDAAFPVLRRPVENRTCWDGADRMRMQWQLAHGDSSGVASAMDRLVEIRGDDSGTGLPLDIVFQEAWLLAESGHPDRALRHLGATLDALAGASQQLLRQPSQSAGLVRALALQAELAAYSGDAERARRAARAVLDLRSAASSRAASPDIERMRVLARDPSS